MTDLIAFAERVGAATGADRESDGANSFTAWPGSRSFSEALMAARRERRRYFPTVRFTDPAWEMLLQLLDCYANDRRVSVSGLSTVGDTPGSTGLRWIESLEKAGIVARSSDRRDSRRSWVGLTETGLAGMRGYMSCLAAAGWRVDSTCAPAFECTNAELIEILHSRLPASR